MKSAVVLLFMFIMLNYAYASEKEDTHEHCKRFNKLVHKAFKKGKIVPNKKNRVFALAGYSYTNDVSINSNTSIANAQVDMEPTLGIGYQRKITNDYNAGFIIQTNSAFFATVGVDF